MSRVVHFEIHASDPERCAAFYRAVFGWVANEWIAPGVTTPPENRYWMLSTGPASAQGIDGGMLIRRGAPPVDGQPINAYICTMDVPSVDATLERIARHGGECALPKMPVPGIGWLAYAKDTEGNLFGIMQNDPTAA